MLNKSENTKKEKHVENAGANTMRIANIYRQLFNLLTIRQKTKLVIALALSLFSSLFDFLSIGAIIPFLFIALAPENLPHEFLQLRQEFVNLFTPLKVAEATLFFLLFVVLILVSTLIRSVSIAYLNIVGYDISSYISRRYLENLLGRDISFFGQKRTSEMVSDLTQKSHLLATQFVLPSMSLMHSVFFAGLFALALYLISPKGIIFAILGISTLYAIAVLITRKKIATQSKIIFEQSDRVFSIVSAAFGGIRDLLLASSQTFVAKRYALEDRKLKRALAITQLLGSVPRLIIEGLVIILFSSAVVFSNVQQSEIIEAIPYLAALGLSAQRLMPIFQQAYFNYSMMISALPIFLAMADARLPKKNAVNSITKVKFESIIEGNKICFSHDVSTRIVINDIDFKIFRGDRIILTGPSGVGKSTLTDIIMGLARPLTGKFTVDGLDLSDDEIADWRSKFAHVPQDVYIYDGTLLENICLNKVTGIDHIDTARLENAVLDSNLAAFVSGADCGYLTHLTENGKNLSGGQRQRIGIARALYRGAEILILDEITSSLDETSSREVMGAIQHLPSSLTIILITHKPHEVSGFDKVWSFTSNGTLEKRNLL